MRKSRPTRLFGKPQRVLQNQQELNAYDYDCKVIGYFKVIAYMRGLQGGSSTFSRYPCLWESIDKACRSTAIDGQLATVDRILCGWKESQVLISNGFQKFMLPPCTQHQIRSFKIR